MVTCFPDFKLEGFFLTWGRGGGGGGLSTFMFSKRMKSICDLSQPKEGLSLGGRGRVDRQRERTKRAFIVFFMYLILVISAMYKIIF